MKVLSSEVASGEQAGKKPKYSRAELREIGSFIGPTGTLLAKTVLKQEGVKLSISDREEDQPRSDGETIAKIVIAKVRGDRSFRIKEARKLGYTIVGQSAAGIIGSAR